MPEQDRDNRNSSWVKVILTLIALPVTAFYAAAEVNECRTNLAAFKKRVPSDIDTFQKTYCGGFLDLKNQTCEIREHQDKPHIFKESNTETNHYRSDIEAVLQTLSSNYTSANKSDVEEFSKNLRNFGLCAYGGLKKETGEISFDQDAAAANGWCEKQDSSRKEFLAQYKRLWSTIFNSKCAVFF